MPGRFTPASLCYMHDGHSQAYKWRRLGYVQLGFAALLIVFAALALMGLLGTPRHGGIAPLLVAFTFLALAVRSLFKSRGLP